MYYLQYQTYNDPSIWRDSCFPLRDFLTFNQLKYFNGLRIIIDV